MRWRVVFSSVILAGLLLALAGVAGASPSVDQSNAAIINVPDSYREFVEISPDGWIEFKQQDYALENSTVYVKEGERTDDGGCALSGQFVLPQGSEAVEVREIAFNPVTCEALLERGIPPRDAALDGATDTQEGATLSDDVDATNSADSGGEFATAAVSRSSGYLESRYKDPPGYRVNYIRNSTDWRHDGRSVRSPVYNGYAWDMIRSTGWQMRKHDWNHHATTYQTTSSSYIHFRNGYFCSNAYGQYQPPTHTYYDRNTVHGRANGSLVGEWRAYKSGGCEGFLRFSKVLRRTG